MIDAVDEPSKRSFGVGASSNVFNAGDSLNVDGSEVTELGAVDDELGTWPTSNGSDGVFVDGDSVSVGDRRLPPMAAPCLQQIKRRSGRGCLWGRRGRVASNADEVFWMPDP